MPGIRGLSSSAADDGMAERHRRVDGPGGVDRRATASWREHVAAAVSVRRAWRRRSIDADMIGASKLPLVPLGCGGGRGGEEKKDDRVSRGSTFN